MDWTIIVVFGVVLAAFFVWKQFSFVSAEVARKHLAEGALVIDVRSPEEFRSGHAANAVQVRCQAKLSNFAAVARRRTRTRPASS